MAILYWTAGMDGLWSTLGNWWTDAEATVQASVVPWIDNLGVINNAADSITLATGETVSPNIDITIGIIGEVISGVCDINNVRLSTANGIIYGGSFSGDNFINNNSIYGGTFSGTAFINGDTIYGGKFSGADFANAFTGVILGGTFSGADFTTYGADFATQLSDLEAQDITITIDPTCSNYFNPFKNIIAIQSGSINYPPIYWKNVSGATWSSADNWFYDLLGNLNANIVPWIDDLSGGVTYGTADLSLCDGEVDQPIIDADIDPNKVGITGTCDIDDLSNNGQVITIYSGTFSGINFLNYATIFGGTFSGDNLHNAGTINGGTFSGDTFYNDNLGNIYGGAFIGTSLTNDNVGGAIYGGLFSYNTITNSGSIINGGVFIANNFVNTLGTVYGGQWLQKGSIKIDGIRQKGSVNPVPRSAIEGFKTIECDSDVIGGGLL